MPADQLTATTPVAASVLRLLAGEPLNDTARAAGLDPTELADALATYHAAGLAALQPDTELHWHQVRVAFPDWDTAETTAARILGPRLDRLTDTGAITGWWFLRKHPCWRLRFARPNLTAVHDLLDDLTAAGALHRWWPTIYEPETTAFGGPAGIHPAHELFCADSHGVLTYLQQPHPGLGRRELSLILLGGLLHGAGLDWFERGDVFARITQIRPTATDDSRIDDSRIDDSRIDDSRIDDSGIDRLSRDVRGLLALPPDADTDLFGTTGPIAYAAPWRAAFTTAGRHLAAAAAAGTLQRGLRAITAHLVIFHWNRFGLSAHTQGILAHAAVEAFLPRS